MARKKDGILRILQGCAIFREKDWILRDLGVRLVSVVAVVNSDAENLSGNEGGKDFAQGNLLLAGVEAVEGVSLELAGRAIGEKFGVRRGTMRIEVPNDLQATTLKDVRINLQP